MPFGPNCEYPDFQSCVDKNKDKPNPEAYCGRIQRATEEHCKDDSTKEAHIVLNKDRLKTARPIASLKQGRNDWYTIKNADKLNRFAEIYIYDEIGFFGVTASDFVKDINALDVREITLHISSPGGEVFDSIAIYNALKDHKAKIVTHIDSLAASGASFIALAGEEVKIAKSATMMVHNAHGLCIGESGDMRKLADEMDKLNDIIADIYADKTGDERSVWRGLMSDETWFNAEEALGYGLADEIMHMKSKNDSPEDKWDLSIFSYQGRDKAPDPSIKLVPEVDHTYVVEALKGAF